jgi:hypothetical protein
MEVDGDQPVSDLYFFFQATLILAEPGFYNFWSRSIAGADGS